MSPLQAASKSSEGSEFEIRLASAADITRLNEICASCFDHSLLWSGDHPASRAWWLAMINGAFAEVWVVVANGAILGFSVLLTDETSWNQVHAGIRMTRKQKASQLLRHPGRVLNRLRYKSSGPESGAALPRVDIRLQPSERVFVEHFAVAKEGRRRGIASLLAKHALGRVLHHKRKGIVYMVDRTNQPMQRVMIAEGLAVMRETPVQFAFARIIETA